MASKVELHVRQIVLKNIIYLLVQKSHTYPLCKNMRRGAVVVAQLAERLLPIPEDPGLNPVISNFY